MKKKFFVVIVCLLLIVCFNLSDTVAKETRPPYIGKGYGDPVPYGEGNHPGIDYDISIGTPIIACSAGTVVMIVKSIVSGPGGGGEFVSLQHENDFFSLYGHLSKVFVVNGQKLERGQLIGLSGASRNGYAHLHFVVSNIADVKGLFSRTLNPHDYWLDGKQQCYDPERDYSGYSSREITVPVARGDYKKFLKSELKK